MISLRFKLLCAVACLTLMATTTCSALTGNDARLAKQIQGTIEKIKGMKGPPSMARTDEAEHLADLTKRIVPTKVDDSTLKSLISLLDCAPDDSVRLWVAVAIGNLGPRASPAVPPLLRHIGEITCSPFISRTPAATPRFTLKRIGVKPPPQNCGETEK